MTKLVKIRNSHDIKIPKPMIKATCLSGKARIIAPQTQARADWEKAINDSLNRQGQEDRDTEWLDAALVTENQLKGTILCQEN